MSDRSLIRTALAAWLVAWLSCGLASPSVVKSDPGSQVKMMSKQEYPTRTFVRGPSAAPASTLIAWFDREARRGQPRMVRLPLILHQGTANFWLRGARIGDQSDAIEVYPNDGALGIGLSDRAMSRCRGKNMCAFWVDAYWRGKPGGGSLGVQAFPLMLPGDEKVFHIDVMNVFAPIEDSALGDANHIDVEDSAPPTLMATGAWVGGFPIPEGSRPDRSALGSMTVNPGWSYQRHVYEIGSAIVPVTAFYGYHLPGAYIDKRDQTSRFATTGGSVTLAPVETGTRITLMIGPQESENAVTAPVNITVVGSRLGKPPLEHLFVDVVVRNDHSTPRWVLIPSHLPETTGGIDKLEELTASADSSSVTIGRFLGTGGCYAVRLGAGTRVTLRRLDVRWWRPNEPQEIALDVQFADEVALGGESIATWFARDPTVLGNVEVDMERARHSASHRSPGDKEVKVSAVGSTRVSIKLSPR